MGAAENKALLQAVFAELAKGNPQAFVEAMADDFTWKITGTTKWSRTFSGRSAVLGELLAGLTTRLAPPIKVIGQNFIADGDFVAVEARGENKTNEGVLYNNTYCFVFRVGGGKLKAVTEYLDTELVTRALG